jgi:hypothetical protein
LDSRWEFAELNNSTPEKSFSMEADEDPRSLKRRKPTPAEERAAETREFRGAMLNTIDKLASSSTQPSIINDSPCKSFGNYVASELRNLPEDSRIDVKFDVQCSLKKAQKELLQKKAEHSAGKSPGK